MTGVRIVYESHYHRSDHVLPPKVENFLLELFQEPSSFSPSDAHEKLQADEPLQLDLFDPGEDGEPEVRH